MSASSCIVGTFAWALGWLWGGFYVVHRWPFLVDSTAWWCIPTLLTYIACMIGGTFVWVIYWADKS
jgi:membrane protein DedA with SNARE-associated domain